MVEEAQADPKRHVHDAEDDGHLHLKGVEEGQLVGGDVPNLLQPEKAKVYHKECSDGKSHAFKKKRGALRLWKILNIHVSGEDDIPAPRHPPPGSDSYHPFAESRSD